MFTCVYAIFLIVAAVTYVQTARTYKSVLKIAKNNNMGIAIGGMGKKMSILNIDSVNGTHRGIYVCYVENLAGQVNHSSTLEVNVFGQEDTQAKLRYYYNSFEEYKELPFDKVTEIFSTDWYNSNKTTTFFCHGFTGYPTGPAVTAIIKTYLEQGQSNVVLLNWDRLAAVTHNSIPQSYLNSAVPNSLKLGADFAEILMKLSQAGLDLNKTHLVGHSLGAHVMGISGNNLSRRGIVLPWITGLDPAGIGFDSRGNREKLNPNSARFVDVVHSDPNKYGTIRSLGTVDFWPNYRAVGKVVQPGCDQRLSPPFTPEDLCNHNRCWEYYVEAIKRPGTVLGSRAKNFRTWKNYNREQRTENMLEISKFAPDAVPGDYYLLTAATSPFGLGEDGL